MKKILFPLLLLVLSPMAIAQMNHDGIQYYLVHLSEYLGRNITIQVKKVSLGREIIPGFCTARVITPEGSIPVVVAQDRIDSFMTRYQQSTTGFHSAVQTKHYLSGTLCESTSIGEPYLKATDF